MCKQNDTFGTFGDGQVTVNTDFFIYFDLYGLSCDLVFTFGAHDYFPVK